MGESVAVYDDNCGMVSYEYDAIGNLTNVIGADGVVVSMSYDLAGRKTDMIDPDKGTWQYAYNTLGEMTRQLDSKGQAIDFSYDDLGRVTERFELKEVTSLTDSSPTLVNTEISSYRTASPGMGQPLSVTYQDSSGVDLHKKAFFYDAYGRVDIVSTSIGVETFAEQTTYDEYSRVFQQFDASGNDSSSRYNGLRYVYSNGYLSQLKEAHDGVSGTVYQDIQAMDARGNVTTMKLGVLPSGGYTAIIDASYEQSSGRLLNLSAYDGNGTEIQDVDYIFDVLGNLKQRHDQSGLTTNLNETFFYDNLNRLETVNLSLAGNPAATTMSLAYNEAGNIMSKSGVGTYLYDASRPHAVSNAGGIEYDYDANGNQISGDGRTITYTVFDKPDSISKDGDQVDFAYGVGNSRYQRIDSGPTLQRTTLYLGSVERITEGSSTYYKRYLGGVAIATYYPSTDTQNIAYLLKDHIGSIHTVLDEDAAITARMHFGAFGERQDMNWQSAFTGYQYALNDITTRGFTGHEQVDSMGIVHMNGRIYDPKLGRFLQADPVVQAPKNSQSLNRYTYVFNNPLSYTDPSGFISFRTIVKLAAAAVITYVTWGAASGWAVGFAWGSTAGTTATLTAAGGAFAGAVSGAVGGAILTGTVKGAFYGALSGTALGAVGASGLNKFSKTVTGGAANGITTELQGGKFGHGFLSAGAGFWAGLNLGGDVSFGKFLGAAIAGGTISELTGGKFANGAISAGLAYAVAAGARTSTRGDSGDSIVFKPGEDASLSDAVVEMKIRESLIASGHLSAEVTLKFDPRFAAAKTDALTGTIIDTQHFKTLEGLVAYTQANPSYELINGETLVGSRSSIIYRSATTAVERTILRRNVPGTKERFTLSRVEHGTFVAAHELAHGRGIPGEFRANRFGLKAIGR